jgi:hypothetical protein
MNALLNFLPSKQNLKRSTQEHPCKKMCLGVAVFEKFFKVFKEILKPGAHTLKRL